MPRTRCVAPFRRSLPELNLWRASQELEAHATSLQSKDAALLALRAEGDALSRKQARVAHRSARGGNCS